MDIRRREGGKSGPKARNPLYFYYTAIFYLLSNAVTGAFIPAYPPADPPDTGPFDAKSGRIHGGYTRFARLSALKIKKPPCAKTQDGNKRLFGRRSILLRLSGFPCRTIGVWSLRNLPPQITAYIQNTIFQANPSRFRLKPATADRCRQLTRT